MTELKKVPVSVAAAILGKSEQFIRCGLQYQRLPFGTAVTTNPDKKPRPYFSYHISPKKFIEYAGCTVEDIIRTAKEIGAEL